MYSKWRIEVGKFGNLGYFLEGFPFLSCLPFPEIWLHSSRENSQKNPLKTPQKSPGEKKKNISPKPKTSLPKFQENTRHTGIANCQLRTHPEKSNIPKKTTFGHYLQQGKAQGIPKVGIKGAGNGSHSQKKHGARHRSHPKGKAWLPFSRKNVGILGLEVGKSRLIHAFKLGFLLVLLPRCPSSTSKNSQLGSYSTLAAPGTPGRDPKEEIPKEFQEEWQ